jgi:two-component SAPR family response regulator
MDLLFTLYLGQTESVSNICSSCTSIHKTFKICRLIVTLAELALEIPNHVVNIFTTNGLSHGSIAHVTEYAQELQTLKDVRIDQITRMATEITRLWSLLGTGEGRGRSSCERTRR